MSIKELSCGCSLDISKDGDGNVISISLPDEKSINLECPKVWDMISRGNTWGVFQLEKGLGQKYSKLYRPSSIDEMGALQSLIRPGCLDAKLDDGKSLTEHACMRKNGKETASPIHSSVEPILSDTQQIICYQEQALVIAKEIAGMSADDADLYIRKGIGKKLVHLINEGKKLFLEGAKKKGIVDEKTAQKIFEGIEASARYAFNKCLCPSTLVETESGEFKSLEEVQIGTKILDHEGEYTTVVDKHNNGEQEVFEVTMESGKSIMCTMNHQFLCEDGKIRPLIDIFSESYKIICQYE